MNCTFVFLSQMGVKRTRIISTLSIARNNDQTTMNSELDRMWKETVVP
jgi:hypothetical protein